MHSRRECWWRAARTRVNQEYLVSPSGRKRHGTGRSAALRSRHRGTRSVTAVGVVPTRALHPVAAAVGAVSSARLRPPLTAAVAATVSATPAVLAATTSLPLPSPFVVAAVSVTAVVAVSPALGLAAKLSVVAARALPLTMFAACVSHSTPVITAAGRRRRAAPLRDCTAVLAVSSGDGVFACVSRAE